MRRIVRMHHYGEVVDSQGPARWPKRLRKATSERLGLSRLRDLDPKVRQDRMLQQRQQVLGHQVDAHRQACTHCSGEHIAEALRLSRAEVTALAPDLPWSTEESPS
jgi:hypothetical protein